MTSETDIFEDLRRRVTGGEFAYGERLRAENLRRDYSCSASTVREVLFRLATVGLVDFQEQRGFRMPTLSPKKVNEIIHMRILLECEGACLSIRNGGVAWEAALTAAHHKLSHIETRMQGHGHFDELPRLWMSAELEFHQTLISACGSDTLKDMHLVLYHQFRQMMIEVDKSLDHLSESIHEHRAIVDAALAGDESAARAAIQKHFARNYRATGERSVSLVG